jgi:hypothetical protein
MPGVPKGVPGDGSNQKPHTMERNWFIFSEEHSGRHWWFGPGLKGFTVTPLNHLDECMIDLETLREIDDNKAKRLFTVDRVRYVVVKRGTMYEP